MPGKMAARRLKGVMKTTDFTPIPVVTGEFESRPGPERVIGIRCRRSVVASGTSREHVHRARLGSQISGLFVKADRHTRG